MRMSLLTKLILFILTPALLGLCVVAGFSSYAARDALSRQIAEEMTLVVDRQKSEISNLASFLNDTMENTVQQPHVQNLLLEIGSGGSTRNIVDLTRQTQETIESMKHYYRLFQGAGLLDMQGRIIAHSNPALIGGMRDNRNYFNQAKQGNSFVENLISQGNNQLSTIMAVAVKKDNKVIGVLFADIDVPALSKATTDSVKLGTTGMSFLLTTDGSIIAHPEKSNIGTSPADQDWARQMMSKLNGRVVYEWSGDNKIAYYREIPGMNWIVVLTSEEGDMMRSVTAMIRSNITIVALAALLVGIIIFLVAKNIAGTLRNGANFAGFVAQGNMNIPPDMQRDMDISSRRHDEIGQLMSSINLMVANIRKLFDEAKVKTEQAECATEDARKATAEAEAARAQAETAKRDGMLAAANRLESVVNIVSSASTELSAQIEQSEYGSTEQAARITETATAMEEMNSTVLEVARNAGTASHVSVATREKADNGASIVKKSLNAIQQVQSKSLILKDDMATLSGHAQSISQIMGVISDIADQTNLLALNAAIEAARAGDAGRGFAVVADEVRKLAEKTMASTADVGNAIRAIQQSAEQSSKQVDEAVVAIEEATVFAGQSGEALAEIVRLADETADQVRAIATASEQQSASSNEINQSIAQVNSIAADTSRAMSEAAHAVSELANQAQVLAGLIEDMKRE